MKFWYCGPCLRALPPGHTEGDVINSRFRDEHDYRRHLADEHGKLALIREIVEGQEARASPPDWYYAREHTYEDGRPRV